jgi:hypothetical protein
MKHLMSAADVLSSAERAFSCEFCQEVEEKGDEAILEDSRGTSQDESTEVWEP